MREKQSDCTRLLWTSIRGSIFYYNERKINRSRCGCDFVLVFRLLPLFVPTFLDLQPNFFPCFVSFSDFHRKTTYSLQDQIFMKFTISLWNLDALNIPERLFHKNKLPFQFLLQSAEASTSPLGWRSVLCQGRSLAKLCSIYKY